MSSLLIPWRSNLKEQTLQPIVMNPKNCLLGATAALPTIWFLDNTFHVLQVHRIDIKDVNGTLESISPNKSLGRSDKVIILSNFQNLNYRNSFLYIDK